MHFNIRLEADRQCILVLMGATKDGEKELIGILDGYRESEPSWKEFLLDVKARGLTIDPKLATSDGALGSGRPCRGCFPRPGSNAAGCTRWPTCWTTSPIESTSATVRLRTKKTKGSGSRTARLIKVLKPMESAQKKWRVRNGSSLSPDVIPGIKFMNGVKDTKEAA